MIHPNMGTMLSFITTDCAISHEMLTDALQENVKKTYNRVTVDGDTSTNDMCVVLANGLAGNELIDWQNEDYQAFCKALNEINTRLARQIAADGEGATDAHALPFELADSVQILNICRRNTLRQRRQQVADALGLIARIEQRFYHRNGHVCPSSDYP